VEIDLVVVVGDHGEGLGDHQESTHGYFLYDPTLVVPMIIKPPATGRYEGGVSLAKGIFQLVDVMPTILQIADIDAPANLQGEGLVAVILGKRDLSVREAYSETYYPNEFGWSELKAWRTLQYKYILAPDPEIYNLQEDPGELRNLIGSQSSLANQFKMRLLDFEGRFGDAAAADEAQKALSPEDLEKFRSLGYIGGPSRGRGAADLELPDPKDKIEEYRAISKAMSLIARRHYDEAIPVLQTLRGKDPNISSVDSMIGQCYLNTGRYREARRSLQKAVKVDPDRVYPRIYLAQTHFHLREYQQAQELLESVIQQDQSSFQAYNYLGLIYSDRGETSKAVNAFKKAVAIQDDVEAYQMLGYLYTREGLPKQAARALEKAIQMDPDHALTHLYLANAYMLLGQRDRGEREYRRALELDPSLRERLP
jgi:tetratricopeptide (TPR) repeat protein